MKPIYVLAPLMLALSSACFGQTEPRSASSLDAAAVSLSIDEAVAAALENNPEIRAAVRRLSLAQLKTTTARSLDDPMLMMRDWDTPLRQPWDLNQAQLMVSLQQTFTSRQKRDQRARLAEDDAGVAAIDLETLRQEVSAKVRKFCADLMRNADEMRLLKKDQIELEALRAARTAPGRQIVWASTGRKNISKSWASRSNSITSVFPNSPQKMPSTRTSSSNSARRRAAPPGRSPSRPTAKAGRTAP